MNELRRSVEILACVVLGWSLIRPSLSLEHNDFVCESYKQGCKFLNLLGVETTLSKEEQKFQSCCTTKDADSYSYRYDLKVGCPVGFKLVSSMRKQYCYRIKGPEIFSDIYEDCHDNKFSLQLYNRLDISKTLAVWSEYKSAYPDGPFIDQTYTDHFTYPLDPKYKVAYPGNQTSEQNLCVLIDTAQNYRAVGCDEKHYRYCVIDIRQPEELDRVGKECKDVHNNYLNFWSPVPTCLKKMSSEFKHDIKPFSMNWIQAQKLCNKHGLSLLKNGWRYVNLLGGLGRIFPLAVSISSSHSATHSSSYFLTFKNTSENFEYGAAWIDGKFRFVNALYNFSEVVCEKTFTPANHNFSLVYEQSGILVFNSTRKIDLKYVFCLRDVNWTFPNVMKPENSSGNEIKIRTDGYYGSYTCLYVDPITMSIYNTTRYIIPTTDLLQRNIYTVKFRIETAHLNYDNDTFNEWQMLQDLMECCMRVRYSSIEDILLSWVKADNIFSKAKRFGLLVFITERKYHDGKTFMFHFWLPPDLKPAIPGKCNNLEILFLRPVLYCDEFRTETDQILPRKPYGTNTSTACATYECKGDFVEGWQWVKRSDSSRACWTAVQVNKVKNELEQLVKDSVPIENITGVLQKVNDLSLEKDLDNSGDVLLLLDQLGSTVKLNGSSSEGKLVVSDVALLVGDSNPNRPILGFQERVTKDSVLTPENIDLIRNRSHASAMNASVNSVAVLLPACVAESTARVSFWVFRNDGLFGRAHAGLYNVTINSHIVGVNVLNVTRFRKGEVIEINFSPLRREFRNESRSCAYWHFAEDNSTGYWSPAGCSFERAARPGLMDTCRCEHLTHFAAILVPNAVFSEHNEAVLEIMTIVGCCLSVLGVTIILITAAAFRSWRADFNNKIWLQLCICIGFTLVCFLIIIFAKYERPNTACVLVGVALHYSVLCSFCWMLVTAVLSYCRLVIVYTASVTHKLLKAAMFSYGIPCVVVGILLSVAPHSYSDNFQVKIPFGSFCYPSGLALWIAVYAPIVTILLINWTLFFAIVFSVFVSKRIQRFGNDHNEALRCISVSCLLVFLFGLPWTIGFLANNVVAAYLCTLTTTFQGFVLFVFVIGKKQTRNMWFRELGNKLNSKVLTNSSSLNMNTVNR